MFRMAIGFCSLAACKMNLYPGEFSSQDLSRNNKVRLKLGNESMNHGLHKSESKKLLKALPFFQILCLRGGCGAGCGQAEV